MPRRKKDVGTKALGKKKAKKKDENGSPGRTRTCNLLVTRAPGFLPGLDYLFTRPSQEEGEGVGRFPRPYKPEYELAL